MTLPEIARKSIEYYFDNQKVLNIDDLKGIDKKFLTQKAGTFVSLHRKDGSLRGCIGTFVPTQSSIAKEVVHNAVSAAFADPRFYPLEKGELSDIDISVDVLSEPEPIKKISELDPKKYGVIVSTPDGRKGLLLPDIEGVDSVDEQLSIACQKAGILPSEDYSIEKFAVSRYQE